MHGRVGWMGWVWGSSTGLDTWTFSSCLEGGGSKGKTRSKRTEKTWTPRLDSLP